MRGSKSWRRRECPGCRRWACWSHCLRRCGNGLWRGSGMCGRWRPGGRAGLVLQVRRVPGTTRRRGHWRGGRGEGGGAVSDRHVHRRGDGAGDAGAATAAAGCGGWWISGPCGPGRRWGVRTSGWWPLCGRCWKPGRSAPAGRWGGFGCTGRLLAERYGLGAVALSSAATFNRLVHALADGRGLLGTARQRRRRGRLFRSYRRR